MPGHLSAAEAPEDLWTCHECGWTYPNHHPSAKHRRNHKKVHDSMQLMGTISSRNGAPGQPAPSVIVDGGSSDDDDSSDDETTPDKTHERGHHHQNVTPAQQQNVATSAGARAAKSLGTSHRSKDQSLHNEEAVIMKPAPLTERNFLGHNNRQALHSTGSMPNTPGKPQHVRRRSAHSLEGVWVCRHCQWTYPNAHPSAKHRRKHKKKCPALVVTSRHVVGAGGSSDDASSDEESKRRDAGTPGNQEAPETSISSCISSLPTSLEAFLGRSDNKRELKELHDTIILLSPKSMSRRNSFKSPRHRREGPSGFLSPRGGVMKTSKAVNNHQAQEVVLTVMEKKPGAVSDQENEDPVLLNLPTVRLVTNSRSVPAAELENEGGDTLLHGRSSSSDESDLINSDGEAPSSPDSVLQPIHLLPVTTSTTEETVTRDDQEGAEEEVTQQPLHQVTAVAAMNLDAETERDESTYGSVSDKENQHEAVAAPQQLLPSLVCEAWPEVDTQTHRSAAAGQRDSQEVSSVDSRQRVDASSCAELRKTETGSNCVAKGTAEKVTLSGLKYLASSLVVNAAVESTIESHVEELALESDIAAEHISVDGALVVGGPSETEASIDTKHDDAQEGEACDLNLDYGDPPQKTDLKKKQEEEVSDRSGSDDAAEGLSLDKDLLLFNMDVSPVDQPSVECASDEEDNKNLSTLISSESSAAADPLPVDVSFDLVAEEEEEDLLAPCDSMEENTNILPETLNAAEVQPTCTDTLELNSDTTDTTTSTTPSPDRVTEDYSSSEPSSNEKVQEEEALYDGTATPSSAMGISDLNSETLPTPKSQVVVTESVGDEDQEVNKCDGTESRETHVVEEKTTSSVATNSHPSVRKEEGPEASYRSGATEEECKEIQRSSVAEESCLKEGEIASKRADDCTAAEQEQSSSNPETYPKLTSSSTEDQVVVPGLKSYVTSVEERQEVSPALAEEVCDVSSTKDKVQEPDHENVSTDKRTEVVEPRTIKADDGDVVVAGKKVDDLGGKEVQVVTETPGLVEEIGEPSSSLGLDVRSSSWGSSSDVSSVTTGAAATEQIGSNIGSEQDQVAVREEQPPTVVVNVSQFAEKEKAPAAKQAGLFGQYKDKFSKLQREPNLKPRESQPTITRLPGSGKRKLLPSLCVTSNSSPFLGNKKQESMSEKHRSRNAQADTEAPSKLTFTRRPSKRTLGGSPTSSPQRAGGPGSPEGLVKERIETFERLIGQTRTFGPLPSPTYKFPVFSFGKPSSPQTPHVTGVTIVTSHPQFEHGHKAAATEEQILATAAHLHHVERKDTSNVQDRDNAPEEVLHDALSHLRHIKTINNDAQDRSSAAEPEDSSSQRISKVPVVKEALEHCVSPVPRLTKAY